MLRDVRRGSSLEKWGAAELGTPGLSPRFPSGKRLRSGEGGGFFPWMERLAEVTGKAEGPLPNITLLGISLPSVTSGICPVHLWPLSGNGEFLQRSRTCPRVARAATGSSGAAEPKGIAPALHLLQTFGMAPQEEE